MTPGRQATGSPDNDGLRRSTPGAAFTIPSVLKCIAYHTVSC